MLEWATMVNKGWWPCFAKNTLIGPNSRITGNSPSIIIRWLPKMNEEQPQLLDKMYGRRFWLSIVKPIFMVWCLIWISHISMVFIQYASQPYLHDGHATRPRFSFTPEASVLGASPSYIGHPGAAQTHATVPGRPTIRRFNVAALTWRQPRRPRQRRPPPQLVTAVQLLTLVT